MTDSPPQSQGTPAALLRYGAAALFHFGYWLVYLNLGWPFDDLRTFYPPDAPDSAYVFKMAVTAGIGVIGLAAISLAVSSWRAKAQGPR